MGKANMDPARVLGVLLGLCFFFSGAAGLVYEIVWVRMLGLVFGHTVFAITTVLAAFMAGLALGASLFGRLIDRQGRPLQVYGLLEVAIGLYALLIPLLFALAQTLYVWLYRSLGFSLVALTAAQFILAFLILLLPTTLMGGTLPVLSKFFVREVEGLGRKVADLYALNTFGAVVGSAAAGFVLLPAIGVKITTILAAAINLGIGTLSVMADRWVRASRDAAAPAPPVLEPAALARPPDEPAPLVTWLVLAGTTLSGAASMIYEVAWTRVLSLVIGSSIYAFSAMLTTFLVGLALGSFLFARIWGRRGVDAALFGWLEVAVGFVALVLAPTFERIPELVLAILQRMSPSASSALLTQFAVSFLAMIVPTTIIGAAFPCAVQICARVLPRVGRDLGQVYSANTLGTIVGAILAGFLLVPSVGAQAAMMAAAAMNATIGLAVITASGPARPVWRRAVALPLAVLFTAAVFSFPAGTGGSW